jgi:hypothetical protein
MSHPAAVSGSNDPHPSTANTFSKSLRRLVANFVGNSDPTGYTLLPSTEHQGRDLLVERLTSELTNPTDQTDFTLPITDDVVSTQTQKSSKSISTYHSHARRGPRSSYHSQLIHAHSHSRHKSSHHSDYSHLSHISSQARPSLIRRPTSTFVIGMEETPTGPSVVEMKTAVVQKALDAGGMGRYQWYM